MKTCSIGCVLGGYDLGEIESKRVNVNIKAVPEQITEANNYYCNLYNWLVLLEQKLQNKVIKVYEYISQSLVGYHCVIYGMYWTLFHGG